MNKVLIVLIKDLLARRNHWIRTALEILLPISIIILLNITPYPAPDPPHNELMDDTLFRHCNSHAPDLFMEIFYEPKSNFIDELMSKVKCFGGFHVVKRGTIQNNDSSFQVGVLFKGLDGNGNLISDLLDYELYPAVNYWTNVYKLWKDPSSGMYSYTSGPLKKLLRLQHAIDESFLTMKNISTPKISFQNTDLVSRSPNIFAIIIMIAFFLGLSLMIPGIVGWLVQEKMTGAKELMLIMGLKRKHLWCSKFLDCLILFGIVQLFIVLFLYVPLTESSHVITTVPAYITWAYLMYALVGIFVFLFFLSCFFNNPTLAVFITQVIWGFSLILYSILSVYSFAISRTTWMISCLLPHFCFFNGLSILLNFDFYRKSVKFGEILSLESSYPSLGSILIMITVDILLYSCLTLYLEQVRPGKFGIPKPYDFCFRKSYWAREKSRPENHKLMNENKGNEDFEPVPNGIKAGISVVNLSKVHSCITKGSVLAVDNISIDFYSGEISSLLGHNGAGKTTTFSLISGLTYANSGKVVINGHDVAENADEARASLGLCPQHDMLLKDLNAQQILYFFGLIKGLTLSEASREAQEFIRKLKLEDVKNVNVSKLSGGQKRKVSLAIALIGGSKVVLLDEPTSGLDPEIRREIWEILLEFRGRRTILLTTHFMEEADAISDRIAVMDHGKIKCYGTPLYLKSRYGSGYTLSVVVRSTDKAENITKIIREFVGSARLKCQNVLTLMYQLPQEEISNFPRLLSRLNEIQESGEINSYSMAFSTFEDVFIRLGGSECENVTGGDAVDNSPYKRLSCSDESEICKVNIYLLPLYQFYALMLKKWIYFTRNYRSFLLFTLIPIAFIVAKFLILPEIVDKIPGNENRNKSLGKGIFTYSIESYHDSLMLYSSSENVLSEKFARYVENSGLKTRHVGNVTEELENIFMDDYHAYMRNFAFGGDFKEGEVKIYHNALAVHILPISINVLYNALLLSSNSSGAIRTSLNFTYSDREKNVLNAFMADAQKSLISCSLTDVPDFIGIHVLFYLTGPVRENYFGGKHLQLMTIPAALYWLSHLVFDLGVFLAYLTVPLFIIGFSETSDFYLENLGELISGSILWCIALILLTYFFASFMTNLGAASAMIATIYCMFTFLVYNFVRWEFWPKNLQYLHPSCIFKMGLHNTCLTETNNYKTALVLYSVVLFIFLILKDSHILSDVIHKIMGKILKIDYSSACEKDAAVTEHEEYVGMLRSRKEFSVNSLIVEGLKKWYCNGVRAKAAVKGITFAVNSGECFGLLGVNGAGKTSTFKMITGDITASQGQVFVNGLDLLSPFHKSKALFQIGYCPQYGGIIPTFRGGELLELFARLRGLRGYQIKRETSRWIERLDLKEHSNTSVECYSGGNQRKLSVGVALIGDCPVVFLDEPTSGVDPVTRRVIWSVINDLRAEGKSVLLTSHSMDECEAVCTRLAIMVNGNFRCFGEITTLKEKFGQGFIVQLKVSPDALPEELAAIKRAMVSHFDPGCSLIDEHLTILEYHIRNRAIKWDILFMKLIDMKENFDNLESFNASATTLEQIFISFARNK